ncbi:Glucocorticoid receptor [Liparis tanakae]|uniref:Glucocorticoid receptor n=1 Tax=Liparis tanakae TaxID=230148 RepID=A0A4Z2E181_9TELE|nr:Glucocorticoid receptor [Liparis tanakae]
MDQGLKRNGSRDDCLLTFVEAGAGELRGPRSPGASNGGRGPRDPRGPPGAAPDPEEGRALRRLKQHQNTDGFGPPPPDLRRPTSVISTSISSILGNLPLPDLFPQRIKQEAGFSPERDGEAYGGGGGGGVDLDGAAARLMEDIEIWRDLDLPGSLPEISDFDFDSEVAHLDNILHDSRGGGAGGGGRGGGGGGGGGRGGGGDGGGLGLLKETKPLMGNGGGNGPAPNGPEQQHHQHHLLLLQQQHLLPPASLLSSVMIKEEKDPDDSFIHIRTPGVVKQEKQDDGGGGFCRPRCLQHAGGAMASSLGVGAGSSYHYRAASASASSSSASASASSSSAVDPEAFGVYSGLAGDSWARAPPRFGDPPGDDGLPSAAALSNFSVSFSRWVSWRLFPDSVSFFFLFFTSLAHRADPKA